MKDETKKYVAGGFVGVLFGIQYFYGNLPNVTNTIVLVQDSIPVSEDISVDSATILSSTTLNIDTEVVSKESRQVVLIATSSETDYTRSPKSVVATVTLAPKSVEHVIQPPVPTKTNVANGYVDGMYVGTRENAYYGYVQVQITFKNGEITNAVAFESPSKQRESQKINARAIPKLQTETITMQSDSVDVVSGATYTSKAFKKSLASAILDAKA